MEKLYIFCLPTEQTIGILKNLYLLLASGCRLGGPADGDRIKAVRPVFVTTPRTQARRYADELETWRQKYEKARTMRFLSEQAGSQIFATRLIEAYTIENTRRSETDFSVEMLHRLFQDDAQPYARGLEWEQDFRSNNPNLHVRIGDDDGVLFIMPNDDAEQTIMAKLLFEKRWVKKVPRRGLMVVPTGDDDPLRHYLLHFGLARISDVESLFFVPATGRRQFSLLLAAVAIIDFSRHPVQGMLRLPKGLRSNFYEHYDLGDLMNSEVKNQLVRFQILANLLGGRYMDGMRDWRRQVGYEQNAADLFAARGNDLLAFMQLTQQWRQQVFSEFRFIKEERPNYLLLTGDVRVPLDGMLRLLNQTGRLSNSRNNAQKKQDILDTLIGAAFGVPVFPDSRLSDYQPLAPAVGQRPQGYDWHLLPHPFALFLHYRMAFEPAEGRLPEAFSRERSVCLDFWELMFCLPKDELLRHFTVEEVVVPQQPEGHYWDVLNTYAEYADIMQQNVCFFLRSRLSGRIVAYTSPYTGFCCRHDELQPLQVAGRTFFGTPRELAVRDAAFRQFVFRYVSLMQAFTPAFQQYVKRALSPDEQLEAGATGFMQAYAGFRRHVPVN